MQSPTVHQLVLQAAIDGSTIRGTLAAPTGEQRDFHGWLELNVALEAMLDRDAARGIGEARGPQRSAAGAQRGDS